MLDEVPQVHGQVGGLSVPEWARALTPDLRETREVMEVPGAIADVFVGDDACLVAATVPSVTHLPTDDFRRCVGGALHTVLTTLRDAGFANPVRMWSFIPSIHDHMGDGLDRYRVFNAGRYDAFAAWYGDAFDGKLPAATGVGQPGNSLMVAALSLRHPGISIENPRQIPAFGYSAAHGPRPPCFSRAVLARLPRGLRLLVSGTASICGEDSLHPGSLQSQLEETFRNLHHLAGSLNHGLHFSLDGVETARVHFTRSADRAAVTAAAASELPGHVPVEYLPATICRPELLVEIEATLAPTST